MLYRLSYRPDDQQSRQVSQPGLNNITPTCGVKRQDPNGLRSPANPITPQLPNAASPVISAPHQPIPAALSIDHLTVEFSRRTGVFRTEPIRAVRGVSLTLPRGRTLAIVGESGSGKTTVARAVAGLVRASAGSISIAGTSVPIDGSPRPTAMRKLVQMVFQDPGGSMNPRHRIEEIVSEPLTVHRPDLSREARREFAAEMLDRCGMPPATLDRFPHQFSGGQRQRIAVARAVILKPPLVICDEPTSALDVSIQAQVITLLRELQRDLGLAYLFISHDLAVVRQMADETAVMTKGEVVELGPTAQIIDQPAHAYSRKLIAAAAD